MNSAVSDVEPRVASRAGLPGCCPQAAGSGRPGVSWAPQRGGKMAWDRCSHFSESSPFSFYSLPRPLPSQDTVLGGVQRRAGRAHGDRKQGLPCKSLEAASYMTCDRVALIDHHSTSTIMLFMEAMWAQSLIHLELFYRGAKGWKPLI